MRVVQSIVLGGAAICASTIMLSTGSVAKEPPVIPLPLSTVEPPRDVAAESWHSPYCAHWNDGCTECTRASKDETPKCNEETDAGRSEAVLSGGGCKRRAIICFKEMDATYFDRICEGFSSEHYFKSRNGSIIAQPYGMGVKWRFDGKQFISERVDPYAQCGPTSCSLVAIGHPFYLLSDHGYILLGGGHMIGIEYLPTSPIFDRNTSGLRCGQSYELWGPQ